MKADLHHPQRLIQIKKRQRQKASVAKFQNGDREGRATFTPKIKALAKRHAFWVRFNTSKIVKQISNWTKAREESKLFSLYSLP